GDSAVPTSLDGLGRHVLQCPGHCALGVVAQEMERSVEPFRELEAEISMAFAQVVGPLDPWQASYHIGAELHGVVHQRRRLGVRVKALLRKCADLKLHEPSEAALGLERSL